MSACQNFRPIAPFFCGKSIIFFPLIQKGVWPYRYAYDGPLVTLILNIFGFMVLAPFYFLSKVHFSLKKK